MKEGLLIMIAPLVLLVFAFTSVIRWLNARAAERKMRERYALLKHLAERPADAAQLVLEQLRQDDAKEEERERAKAVTRRRGKMEGGVIVMAVGAAMMLFLSYIVPSEPGFPLLRVVWLIGLMPFLVGVVLVVSGWLEKPK